MKADQQRLELAMNALAEIDKTVELWKATDYNSFEACKMCGSLARLAIKKVKSIKEVEE